MRKKAKIGYPVITRILEEISIIDKINRRWKDGLITEFQFSESLDRLLLNIKAHQTELKQPGPQSPSEKLWREKND